MRTKVLTVLVGLLLLSMLSGCDSGEQVQSGDTTVAAEQTNAPEATSSLETTPAPETTAEPSVIEVPSLNNDAQITVTTTAFPKGLSATKIGSLKDVSGLKKTPSGLIYYDYTAKKYGLMSFDGKSDTGAKYGYCSDNGSYYIIGAQELDFDALKTMSIEKMNSFGLVDINGKVLIPEQYANIEVLSDRFARVMTATGRTDSKDEMITYYSNNFMSIMPDEDDIMIKGTWSIYDISTGKLLDGIGGTKGYKVEIWGNYIIYYTDSYQEKIVRYDGQSKPESSALYSEGSLVYQKDGLFCNSDGVPCFKFPADTSVYGVGSDCVVLKKFVNGSYKYRVYDKTGRAISAEFDEEMNPYGNLILTANEVYNFKGDLLAKCSGDVYADYDFTSYLLEEGDTYTLIKDDGSVLYTVKKNTGVNIDTDTFTFYKGEPTKYVFYSFKDKDYTLNGYGAVSQWLIYAKDANDFKNNYLIDTLSGEVLLSGYYEYSAYITDSAYYVYAKNYAGGYDVYQIKEK